MKSLMLVLLMRVVCIEMDLYEAGCVVSKNRMLCWL